jgi:hypothetical protein
MRYRFFVFFLFLFSTGFGQASISLSLEESAVLRKFFEILIRESEAGYVIFNKKPVCIHGFYCRDPFRVNTSVHKQSVALREGARIWNKFNEKKSDIIVHICEKEDPIIPGYIHVLIINRPFLQAAVKNNLTLFQYVLGPSITPNSLVDTLLSKGQTYCTLLKENKVLTGEILGFGTQNSLYGSRIENIQEALEKDIPPFLHNQSLIQEYNQEYLPFPPSFGFKSLKEELNDLQEKMTLSSENLTQKNPAFIFGWLKDSKKTKEFVYELEITQDKIKKLCISSGFLEKILKQLTGKKYFLNANQKFQFLFEKAEINKVVAKGLWETIQDYDYEYVPYFIEGINKLESQHFKNERLAWFPWYRREFLEGKENLQKSDDVFTSLDNDKSFQCVVPQKVYYKTLKNGYGNIECNGPCVLLSYSIISPLGHCLANHDNVFLNLKNTIPGFAHGIKGMKIGETREIFIHPSLAYGFDTSLEKCIHLKAIVTLLDIQNNNGYISNVDCIDLSFLMDPKIMKTRDENYKMALIEKGMGIAKHLKKCREIDLTLIADYLKNFYSNKEKSYSTTQAEQDLINRVHWNIYYSSYL